ncbi:zinc ribbon domain-containing protein [Nocardioides mangrovi]|uniref:zinc ribbon domain-containing protein n=1 Tax=Nocardioides mangrovi TaxID=2874580 RepID=UPI003FD82B5A
MLDLQALDSRADQLRHQRASLPEIAEIAELEAKRGDVDNLVRDARIAVDDLTLEQQKVDQDVEAVKTRRTRDRDRMDQGLVTNPKDLERMQQELVSLDRRISTLEDDELEVMQRLEDAQGELTKLEGMVAETDEKLGELRVARDEKVADLDARLADVSTDRGPAAEGLPDDLVALYARLREQKGGIGAAELRARACGGCRLTLDAGEINRIRGLAIDEVVRCEECQRILVRTPESGL